MMINQAKIVKNAATLAKIAKMDHQTVAFHVQMLHFNEMIK
jgi:hypothetical protein